MATHDDRQWILSLVQNAYVTTDDTEDTYGVCEVIFQNGEEGKKKVAEYPYLYQENEMLQSESGEPHLGSPDIDSYDSSTKFRPQITNEKVKKDWKATSRVKKAQWEYNTNITDEDLQELFERKVVIAPTETAPVQSAFSHLLETHQENNPYVSYSQFDGKVHSNLDSRDIQIYIYHDHNLWNNYPLCIKAVKDAKVEDIIGLICLIYTNENNDPPLKDVSQYELYIAEEDGSVELDLPPLERRDLIEKFSFPILALVESDKTQKPNISVKVYFAKAFSVIELEHERVTLKEVLERSISRRREIIKLRAEGFGYHLEKENELGVPLDMNKTVAEVNCTEFAAVRDHSKRTHRYSSSHDPTSANETFYVTWQRRVARFETKLEIGSENIFFYVLNAKGGSGLLARPPHPVKYPTSLLADISHEDVDKKKTMTLIITMQGEDNFKRYRFVCEPCDGIRLLEKCKYLLQINLKNERKPSLLKRRNSMSYRKKSSINSFHREI